MNKTKKRCPHCRRWFKPDPRAARRQRYCGRGPCRRASRKRALARWADKNPQYWKGAVRRRKIRLWAKKRRYWKRWRKRCPAYVEINRQKQLLRNARRRRIAKQDEMTANSLWYLEEIRHKAHVLIAKQDEIRLPIEGILDFLILKEGIAKQEQMALPSPGAS